MLRKVELAFTFNTTCTAKKIIFAIMDHPLVQEYHKNQYPKLEYFMNFSDAVERFSLALEKAYKQLNFSYKKYNKLSELEKTNLENCIADYMVNKHGNTIVFYEHEGGKKTENSIRQPCLLQFYCLKERSEKPDALSRKIEILKNDFIEPISLFLKTRQYLVVAAGYLDGNSFFSHLPTDLRGVISNHLTFDYDSSKKVLVNVSTEDEKKEIKSPWQ